MLPLTHRKETETRKLSRKVAEQERTITSMQREIDRLQKTNARLTDMQMGRFKLEHGF